MFTPAAATSRLPYPFRDEAEVLKHVMGQLGDPAQPALDWPATITTATPWVQSVRDNPAPFWAMESLLREYPISTQEGLALMRLAEALLRVPDAQTAIALTADQLGQAQFDGSAGGAHSMMANISASAISLSKKFLPGEEGEGGLFKRLGAQTVVAATVRAIQLLGKQFVLGRNIEEALGEARSSRKQHSGQAGLRYSYDMLGEGARTEADAVRYLGAYRHAIEAIAAQSTPSDGPMANDGISIKLSALFSRYEDAQRDRVFAELLPRVWQLIELAAAANVNLTIDAEESERLELSLDVLDALAARIAQQFPLWQGFGLALQAYQTRALPLVHEVAAIARRHGLRFMVRLVKGAYWDAEVKRAQELGLAGYPVFTHKHHTDISYLACAQALLGHADVIYPQFATHNAGTIAAVVQMAQARGAKYEMQRLHGMGQGVYREVMKDAGVPVRIYAPVGEHRDLLAYLVRRLLENGANSSFVHLLADEAVPPAVLLASPLHPAAQPALPMPVALYGAQRANSRGLELTCIAERAPLQAAYQALQLPPVPEATGTEVATAMARLSEGFAAWNATPTALRAAVLRRSADALEARLPEFCALLVREAHKTWGDTIAEVREAVDFCRYYADQADAAASDGAALQGRGVFVCISPWNFPLAIFAGQVVAALVAGNTVAAKPAEQTPAVALRFVALMREHGLPANALALLHGPGETVGAALVAHPATAGVCFTGSTAVAHIIHRTLAAKGGVPVPLIAETGGINAMVVDSSALPEQVVDAVVQSAFRSAGQRCSALRLLCVHEGIADGVIEMVHGALKELRLGDPAELATDVGPVIDTEAHTGLSAQVQRLHASARFIGAAAVPAAGSVAPQLRYIAPAAFEVTRIADVSQEIFGPVLHIVRWGGDVDAVVEQINALGYGLTLGLQTRIDSRAQRLADAARIGNVYVNRNIIGAVVGVQPFGGEGLSGTGPKAGGPHYLHRFAALPAVAAAVGDAPVAAEAVSTDLTLAWTAAADAQITWADTALDVRVAVLQALGRSLPGPAAQALSATLAAGAAALAPRALPGPTGERNTLRLHGRGVLACVATGASAEALATTLGTALLAGNSVLVLADGEAARSARQMASAVQAAGLPGAALQVQAGGPATLAAVLTHPSLAGVCFAVADAAREQTVQRALAQRSGAILPLITAAESLSPQQRYRFCTEQTLTVNTAAAGGNVELMAGPAAR